MVEFSTEFLNFLKAYDSTAYADATAMIPDDKKAAEALEARKNEIYAAWKDKEAIWESIPRLIRDRYPDMKIPEEIMSAAAKDDFYTLRVMAYNPSIKTPDEAHEKIREAEEETKKWADITTKAAVEVAVVAMVAGYSAETSHALATERQFRDGLLTQVGDVHLMSPEDKAMWRESRKKDKKAILAEFQKNQPEKMLMHLLFRYNHGKEDEKTFARDVAELVKRIETDGRQDHLLKYLKSKPIQAKLRRFKPETLEIFSRNVLPYVPENERGEIMENIKAANVKPEKNINTRDEAPKRQRERGERTRE